MGEVCVKILSIRNQPQEGCTPPPHARTAVDRRARRTFLSIPLYSLYHRNIETGEQQPIYILSA